ncbi:MAG: hypothetical protein E7K04_05475 [Helicobacter sp.]|nr:hypothetical protein [Helicobacter sp.]
MRAFVFKLCSIFGVLALFAQLHSAPFFSRYKQKPKPAPVALPPSKIFTYEISAGAQYYRYEEPGVMHIKGPMTTFDGSVGVIDGLFKYQLEGYFSNHIGSSVYHGGLIDTTTKKQTPFSTKSTDFYFGVNAKTGIAVVKEGKQTLFAYVGLGYRFLDNFNIDPPHLRASYERLQGYLYAPIGLMSEIALKPTLSLLASFEFRGFLFGHNSSLTKQLHFDSDLHFTQGLGDGLGMRLSGGVKIYLETKEAIKVEAFYDYWDVADSTTQEAFKRGVSQGIFVEPKNNTNAFGLSVGYIF